MRGKGVCKAVIIILPTVTVKDDFLPLEFGNVDVILGLQWLHTMGYMGVDWPFLTMTFTKWEN